MEGKETNCQLRGVSGLAEGPAQALAIQRIRRLRNGVRRRLQFLRNIAREVARRAASAGEESKARGRLQAGDLVLVNSRREIEASLDRWNSLRHCAFLPEMWRFCGTRQRVLKRVEQFLDERDYHVKKASGLVILDGVLCGGTAAFGRCDRSCFYFWREEWLAKVDP